MLCRPIIARHDLICTSFCPIHLTITSSVGGFRLLCNDLEACFSDLACPCILSFSFSRGVAGFIVALGDPFGFPFKNVADYLVTGCGGVLEVINS